MSGVTSYAIANRAAELVSRPNGWCQNDFNIRSAENGELAFCMVGAVEHAMHGLGAAFYAQGSAHSLHESVGRVYPLTRRPASWNDDPSRNQFEVAAALRLLADLTAREVDA